METFIFKGYQRILKDLKQSRDRRHILKDYYLKVKDVLQETPAKSEKEQDDFPDKAEKYIAELEKERCAVFIAGKTNKSRCLELISEVKLKR